MLSVLEVSIAERLSATRARSQEQERTEKRKWRGLETVQVNESGVGEDRMDRESDNYGELELETERGKT